MSRLTWVERDHGWRADPYLIELAAPQLWVCTRLLRDGSAVVEATGGSLSAMKAKVEELHWQRHRLRSLLVNLAVLVAGLSGVVLGAGLAPPVGPALVIGLSVLVLVSGIKAVDCVIRRSWESLASTYQ